MKVTKGDILYRLLKPPVKLYLKNKFNMHIENNPLEDIDEPYLLLGHHVTAFDPIISNMLSNRLVRYIAADANYDNMLKKFLLDQLDSIPFSKNRADAGSVRKILKNIKMGNPIGLYPEGGRNWDGETDRIIPSTAKLIKLMKVPVYAVFYKGGYLSKPRWASHFRKGKMVLDVKKIFRRDDTLQKTSEDIYDLLVDRLSYNEYDWQKENRIPFKGQKLAEDIERLLYICPNCMAINNIQSQGDKFYCKSCNVNYSINEYGMIVGCPEFDETVSWNKWQRSFLPDIIKKGFSFSNHGMLLEERKLESKRSGKKLVTLTFTQEKIIIKYENGSSGDIYIDDLSGLSITFLDVMEFFVSGTKYRLTFDPKRHMSIKLFYDLVIKLKGEKDK